MRKQKFDRDTEAKIARAYLAGASPTEVGNQFGASCPHVIYIARKWENAQKLMKLEAIAKRHERLLRMVIAPPPIQTPEPESGICAGYPTTKMVKNMTSPWAVNQVPIAVTLRAVSLPPAEAMGRNLREAR